MLKSIIFRDIDNLAKHINTLYESIFKKYGLHRGQFSFITRIVENHSISLKDLASSLRVDKTTVTKAIQKLENIGYVKKIQDNSDNRLFHLIATDNGIHLYKNIIKEKNHILEKVLQNFSDSEIVEFSVLINRMNNCLTRYYR